LNKVLDKMEKYFILFTWKYIYFFSMWIFRAFSCWFHRDGSIVTKDNCCHQTTVYSSPFGWFLNSLDKPIVMLVSLIWKSVMSYILKERAVTLKTFLVPSVLEVHYIRNYLYLN
jgi:hypothetical protein